MLYLILGASGSGKSTLIKKSGLKELISHTTRKPRKNEVDGVDYFFISSEVFDKMQKENQFIETTTYSKNNYGLSKEQVEKAVTSETKYITAIDYNGYLILKNLYPSKVIGISIECPIWLSMYRMIIKRKDSLYKAFSRICHSIKSKEKENNINIPLKIHNYNHIEDTMSDFLRLIKTQLVVVLSEPIPNKTEHIDVLLTYLSFNGYNIVNKDEILEIQSGKIKYQSFEHHDVKQILNNIEKAGHVLVLNSQNVGAVNAIIESLNMSSIIEDECIESTVTTIINSEP